MKEIIIHRLNIIMLILFTGLGIALWEGGKKLNKKYIPKVLTRNTPLIHSKQEVDSLSKEVKQLKLDLSLDRKIIYKLERNISEIYVTNKFNQLHSLPPKDSINNDSLQNKPILTNPLRNTARLQLAKENRIHFIDQLINKEKKLVIKEKQLARKKKWYAISLKLARLPLMGVSYLGVVFISYLLFFKKEFRENKPGNIRINVLAFLFLSLFLIADLFGLISGVFFAAILLLIIIAYLQNK